MDIIRIPIAEDCNSTFYLKENGLRLESYFFDWIVISPKTACDLIKNDFKDFFVKDNLSFAGKGNTKFKKAEIYVHDFVNDIFYIHHFNDIEKDFEPLKEKFERKIDRMNFHFKNNKKIDFFFKKTNYNSWKSKSKQKWGDEEIKREFPLLKKFLLEKYSYSNENDINLIIL